jgi:uncharacterized membrane protein HdeD (DUF308 family)
METITVIFVGVAALAGGVINSLLAWTKQSPPEPWDTRKFISSFIASLIGAVVIAAGFNYSGTAISPVDFLAAFLAGAGVQGGVANVSGAIAARAAKLSK